MGIINRNTKVQTFKRIKIKMTENSRLEAIEYEDFNRICRLCCRKSDNLIRIYQKTDESSDNFDSNIIVVMLLNIGLNIKRSDGLPETLCSNCHTKLLRSNSFREQCISSTVYLQEILEKYKKYIEVKSEASDYTKNFEEVFEIDYLDQNDLDATDTDFGTNCRVEELEISLQNADIAQIEMIHKRKRGRPKMHEEKPPLRKRSRSEKLSETCESSTHRKKKSDSRKDICLICGKVVNHNIKGHQAIHDKSEKFECDICGFETYVKLYIKNHMNKKHIAQRQYPCPHCHLVFMHAITLKRHTTIHTGEKNHVCEECGKSYRQRDMLTAHRKRHLPPTIQCQFCDKLFYSKNELKSHVGLHTGIKAFKCDICTAAFVASSSLAAHRRQHKKDNILPSCKLCGMMFNDRLTYNMHLMDHKRINQSIAYNNRQ